MELAKLWNYRRRKTPQGLASLLLQGAEGPVGFKCPKLTMVIAGSLHLRC